jgi:hypothetical protein
VVAELELAYQCSIMQAEYATDLVFKSQKTLQAFYPPLLETLTHAVKPADMATFLGRKLSGNYQGEMGIRFNTPALAGGAGNAGSVPASSIRWGLSQSRCMMS